MEILNIKNIRSKIEEKENQLEYYTEKKNKAKLRVLPKATQLNGNKVTSSIDTSMDKMLEYVAEAEELDEIINRLNLELKDLQRFEEKELKRLSKFDDVEQLVIQYKLKGMSWSKIQIKIDKRELGCSLRTARRIWHRYNKEV